MLTMLTHLTVKLYIYIYIYIAFIYVTCSCTNYFENQIIIHTTHTIYIYIYIVYILNMYILLFQFIGLECNKTIGL